MGRDYSTDSAKIVLKATGKSKGNLLGPFTEHRTGNKFRNFDLCLPLVEGL